MSADAKIWKDSLGWHGICDAMSGVQVSGTEYELKVVLDLIERAMECQLDWEIFQFGNGPGLRGYRAKSSGQG